MKEQIKSPKWIRPTGNHAALHTWRGPTMHDRLFFTRYRTTGERSPSLYHSRQCGRPIVVKPRLDCPGYTVVCFMTHDCSTKLKTLAVQAKCG